MVRQFVKREGISINQFVTLALAEKVPALATESYLEKRAKRGNKQKFSPSFVRGR